MTTHTQEARTKTITRTLEREFNPTQAQVLAQVITDAYDDLVKTSDFNELKAIMRDLAVGQVGLQEQIRELTAGQVGLQEQIHVLAVGQVGLQEQIHVLAVGQVGLQEQINGLAVDMRALAEAQRKTEVEVGKLAALGAATRSELAGLSRSTGYALENEAYRMLPALLETRHGIRLTERLIRTEIGGQEVNLFGHGEHDGLPVLVVGEAKLQLTSTSVLTELDRRVAAVREAHPGLPIIPILVTHFARQAFLKRAGARGVIVVQSFEW